MVATVQLQLQPTATATAAATATATAAAAAAATATATATAEPCYSDFTVGMQTQSTTSSNQQRRTLKPTMLSSSFQPTQLYSQLNFKPTYSSVQPTQLQLTTQLNQLITNSSLTCLCSFERTPHNMILQTYDKQTNKVYVFRQTRLVIALNYFRNQCMT